MEREFKVGYHKKPRAIWLISLCTALFLGGVAHAAPQYSLTCSSCHGMPPVDSATRDPNTGSFAGNHVKHLPATVTISNCTICHNANWAVNNFSHMDGKISFQDAINASPKLGAKYTAGATAYGLTVFKNQTSVPTLGTCSNVNCHFESITPTWGSPAYTYTSTTVNDCDQCHGAPSNTGSHSKHVKSGSGITSCSVCHPNHTAETTKFAHATSAGNRALIVTFAGAPNGTGVYAGSTKKNYPNYLPSGSGSYGTCSATYCHSSGAPQWGATTPLNCDSCHPSANLSGAHKRHIGGLTVASLPFYQYTANKSTGTDPTSTTTWKDYGFGCVNCHPFTDTSHVNGIIEVQLAAAAAGGSLRAKNGSVTMSGSGTTTECGNVYCHSDGKGVFKLTGTWGSSYGVDRCAKCHGNAPSSGAHVAHAVGIHYDNIFNGSNGKLATTGTASVASAHGVAAQSTTISCNICHFVTTNFARNKYNSSCSTASCHQADADITGAARITDLGKHANGTVELSFNPISVVSKAQLRQNSFTDYTAAGGYWTRSGTYKSGNTAYDTAKTALNNSMWSSGTANCSNIACHMGKTVNWNAGNINCESCHSKL